jgi:hypothetical protein
MTPMTKFIGAAAIRSRVLQGNTEDTMVIDIGIGVWLFPWWWCHHHEW